MKEKNQKKKELKNGPKTDSRFGGFRRGVCLVNGACRRDSGQLGAMDPLKIKRGHVGLRGKIVNKNLKVLSDQQFL